MNKRPTVKLDSGRRVKSSFENDHFFFYFVRNELTAIEIMDKLTAMGYEASVDNNIGGPTKWFTRVKINREKETNEEK